jgi:hypothetical protein
VTSKDRRNAAMDGITEDQGDKIIDLLEGILRVLRDSNSELSSIASSLSTIDSNVNRIDDNVLEIKIKD